MSFELINTVDNSIFHSPHYTAADINSDQLLSDSLDHSTPFGEVKSKQWIFNGIRMAYSDCLFKNSVDLDWPGELDQVTMFFNLKGAMTIQMDDTTSAFVLRNNQHNMVYGLQAQSKMKVEELSLKLFIVQFTKDAFLKVASNGNDVLKRFADEIPNGKLTVFSQNNLNIDLGIQSCIHSILDNQYSEPLKRLFLLSKSIELMALQAESYNKAINLKPVYAKTDYDTERILFARDYLIENIGNPPTLIELSRIAGINEFKLKRGFKEMFGQTAYSYLSEVRLELAKNDLLQKRKSSTEIAFELGYSSLQHFSFAFKKKFGVSPKQLE